MLQSICLTIKSMKIISIHLSLFPIFLSVRKILFLIILGGVFEYFGILNNNHTYHDQSRRLVKFICLKL